jgi:hypothetical protein
MAHGEQGVVVLQYAIWGRCSFDSLCGLTSRSGFHAHCDNVGVG